MRWHNTRVVFVVKYWLRMDARSSTSNSVETAPAAIAASKPRRERAQGIARIRRGEELSYDYCLIVDERMTPTLKRQYQCRCGSTHCRGTMLALKKRNGVR